MNEIISVKQLSKSYGRINWPCRGWFVSHAGTVFRATWSERCRKKHYDDVCYGTKEIRGGTVSILGRSASAKEQLLRCCVH